MKAIPFILIVLSLVACRSTRQIQTAISRKDSTAVPVASSARNDSMRYIQDVWQQVRANNIGFQTFTAKVNVDYRGSDGKNYDVNANIRMYKDSAIWISANAVLGIEAMRALITRDSVKLLDKLNKTYTARSVDYLQEVSSLPLNLSILQDLIIGNPVFLDSNVVSYSRTPEAVSLLSLGRWFKNLVTFSSADRSLQRSKLDDADLSRNRTAELTYTDYESKEVPLFATKRRIMVAEKKNLDIKLDFKQYKFNEEVSFPFTVPKNYTSN